MVSPDLLGVPAEGRAHRRAGRRCGLPVARRAGWLNLRTGDRSPLRAGTADLAAARGRPGAARAPGQRLA
jgi:hypothetical protein